MTDDSGALSIDFIVGFTIFLIAFIWVISLVPGLLINLQGYTIDYDAVAYRTGVILVEDPGWPSEPTSPWESQIDKTFIKRFGLAISRDTPNILSQEKVNRFFCTTDFVYPADYKQKVIFGDYPYGFNISLYDIERNESQSKGDVLPEGYGYIRRLVKIKGASNTTIDGSKYKNTDQNVTSHRFSILINTPQLYDKVTDLSYQIDPASDQIMINITNLSGMINPTNNNITLNDITVTGNAINTFRYSTPYSQLSLDNNTIYLANKLPQSVNNSISLKFSPSYFRDQVYPGLYDKSFYKPIYINLSFTLGSNSTFLNNSWSSPFDYDYNPANVTQPKLRDAVLEVAVWSGATSSYGGSAGPQPPIAAFSGAPLSGPTLLIVPVQFTDTSTGGVPNSWKWEYNKTIGGTWTEFGSGAQNPSRLFAPGTYDIRLTVANGYGSSNETKLGYITVPYPLTAIGAITGTPQEGKVLTAGALTPAGATATYQWQRCTGGTCTTGGTYTAISGATATTYTPVAGDVSYYIKVAATGTGSYSGTVTSAYVGPVTTPLTAIGAITGTPLNVGKTLTSGALTPAGATATYQWQRCTGGTCTTGGTYTAISGATATTYTLVAGDVGYYIEVVATGTGSYTGSVTSAWRGPV